MLASVEQLATLSDREKVALEAVVVALHHLYGPRLRRLILYGSKARGDATPESDIDILALIEDVNSRFEERRRINAVVVPIALKHNVLVSVLPVDAEFYESATIHPFYRNVRAEGILL
jgi:predicted nucleotidyltransferase